MQITERPCRIASCPKPAIGTRQFCPPHWRAAQRWMTDEARLDFEEEERSWTSRNPIPGDADWTLDAQ